MSNDKESGYIFGKNSLPENFPTHKHASEFWESLGRTIATFGFLEEVLSNAVFSLTATRPYKENEIQKAYDEWLPLLERILVDPLGNLIETYGKAIDCQFLNRVQQNATELACEVVNTVTHMGWQFPGSSGPGKAVWDSP